MNSSHKIFIVFLTLLYLGLVLLERSGNKWSSHTLIPATHYRQADVQVGISQYPVGKGKSKPVIRGGIVSHHLLAQASIARYFQNLSNYRYEKVIIIGPNHGELGEKNLITTDAAWDTPYGQVFPSETFPSLVIDNEIMGEDHSLEVIMPFIKYYLPQAQVVPILVKASTSMQEIENLVQELTPLVTDNTLILVSTDFSHYLLPEKAYSNDRVTLGLIKMHDYDKLSRLGNGYLDSPNSVIILLKLMEGMGLDELQVFDHTDGSTIAGIRSAVTTTYYFLNFYAKTP